MPRFPNGPLVYEYLLFKLGSLIGYVTVFFSVRPHVYRSTLIFATHSIWKYGDVLNWHGDMKAWSVWHVF